MEKSGLDLRPWVTVVWSAAEAKDTGGICVPETAKKTPAGNHHCDGTVVVMKAGS